MSLLFQVILRPLLECESQKPGLHCLINIYLWTHFPFLQAWGAASFPGSINIRKYQWRYCWKEEQGWVQNHKNQRTSRTLMVPTDLSCPEQPHQRPLPAVLPRGSLSAQCWAPYLGLSYMVGGPASSPISQLTPWTHAATLPTVPTPAAPVWPPGWILALVHPFTLSGAFHRPFYPHPALLLHPHGPVPHSWGQRLC